MIHMHKVDVCLEITTVYNHRLTQTYNLGQLAPSSLASSPGILIVYKYVHAASLPGTYSDCSANCKSLWQKTEYLRSSSPGIHETISRAVCQ